MGTKSNLIYILILTFVIVTLMLWTLQRNCVYKSDVSLWEDTFLKSPNKTRVLINLATAYKHVDEREKGIAAMMRAVRIDPDLIPYFKALQYVHDQGGSLVTEKDLWNREHKIKEGGDASAP